MTGQRAVVLMRTSPENPATATYAATMAVIIPAWPANGITPHMWEAVKTYASKKPAIPWIVRTAPGADGHAKLPLNPPSIAATNAKALLSRAGK